MYLLIDEDGPEIDLSEDEEEAEQLHKRAKHQMELQQIRSVSFLK